MLATSLSWGGRGKALFGAALVLVCVFAAHASEVGSADLNILGLTLEVSTDPVSTGVDIPAVVQTKFGADADPSLLALGDLMGPGIDTPITLSTKPGHQFVLPALHEKGEYTLSNIRLANADGQFLSQAIPSFAAITVTDPLSTSVTVKQLTPDQLRERGISVDARNFDVFEYTFVFAVNGENVSIPYNVIVDRRTHEVITPPAPKEYPLPPSSNVKPPPRFEPPTTIPLTLAEDTSGDTGTPQDSPNPDDLRTRRKPSIPAAIVIPTGFGVLHQFFAVILQVSNAAPDGSTIQLDSITGTIDAPNELRVAKTSPAVSFGQPLPIYSKDGHTILVAGATGSGEWDVEALKAGTHTINIDVKATYKNTGQPDIPLKGRVSSSIVVSDPRFHITFSHPDTIRKDEPYTAYAFVTNLSPQTQTIHLDTTEILACGSGSTSGVCRTEGTGITDLTLKPGEMSSVPYKLKATTTGRIFAAAGSASDVALGVDVKLTMGVSESGIPLSPATLVMPYYARFLDQSFVDANMQLLGLGYSLATAPLNQATAKFPRVLKSDVFQRAQEITRAGQRVFITRHDPNANDPAENRDAFFNLSLDLLDNVERVGVLNTTATLAEWDQLRRSEESGRRAAAAMAQQLETNGLVNGKSMKDFVDDFATATLHRSPYALVLVRGVKTTGTRPYALTIIGGGKKLDVPAEATTGWIRDLPFAELTQFDSSTETGELALIGRWSDTLQLSIKSASDHFSVDVIYPNVTLNGANASFIRKTIDVTGAQANVPVTMSLARGVRDVVVSGATAVPTDAADSVTPLRIVAAAQDLHLDNAGHIVSILFNRPITVADTENFRDLFAITTSVSSINYSIRRKNTATTKFIPGAAAQDDARIVNVSFDKSLSSNATYTIDVDEIADAAVPSNKSQQGATVVPRIDNKRPGGLVAGQVLNAANVPLKDLPVQLIADSYQYDTTIDQGRFLFEFVPRDIDAGINGNYNLSTTTSDGKYTEVNGTVRLPGQVQIVNLVFLGRGSAAGKVTYSDGVPLANANVVVNSPVFKEWHSGLTKSDGNYEIADLPVGPLTFIVRDDAGRITYATNQIATPGQVVTQDLVIQKKDFPGTGTIRVTVRRSDFPASDPRSIVPNAHVGVYTQGYGLTDAFTDSSGKFEFTKVPAGLVSLLAAEFSITRESAGIEMDLKPDTVIDTTITLHVATTQEQAGQITLVGVIKRDDPTAPQDSTKDVAVAGAVINVTGLEGVVADADGKYAIPNVPLSFGAKARMTIFDPATGRRGSFLLPTLVLNDAKENTFSPKLQSSQPAGVATMRVRVFGPHGEPASGMKVILPGYPPTKFNETQPGVYDYPNIPVPVRWTVYAIPDSAGAKATYGEQVVHGDVRVDFDGQIGVLDLRLLGQGTILATIEQQVPCANGPCYARAFGSIDAVYPVWDDAEQSLTPLDHVVAMNQETNVATIKVPANVQVLVETVNHPSGYASKTATIGFEGDTQNVALRLSSLGDVTGRVLMFDAQTPVSGASVSFSGSVANILPVQTAPDGSFKFTGVAANQSFHLVAKVTQDGISRTGYVDAATPQGGGPVGNLVIILREQSTIEGTIKDASGNAVPLAKFWVRELWWPFDTFGSQTDPLFADKNGHFVVNNVFTGPFRISAVSPDVQEVRGDYQGTLKFEADNSQRNIPLTITGLGGGLGTISVLVQNPQDNFAHVANAEVSLLRNGTGFDFQTTDANGVAVFDQVPVSGTYTVSAYSKALGRAGAIINGFGVVDQQTTNVSVLLSIRGAVSGTLQDPESEPIANGPVRGAPITLRTGAITTRASTDGTGAFEFLGIPEGGFTVEGVDPDSGRFAPSPSGLFINSLFQESRNIKLFLEQTATLHVKAYLPDDAGNAGVLAPLVNVKVTQPNYSREQQGNDLDFRKMFAGQGYTAVITELGGENRVVEKQGGFGGALTGNLTVVFPTSGSVQVTVRDSHDQPVANASVTINGGGKSVNLFTGANGVVAMSGFALNVPVSAQATKDGLSASAGGTPVSHSTPLLLNLNLGDTISIGGFVEAENGIGVPSVGTRVLATITSRLLPSGPLHLETRTGSDGKYKFNAIPVGGTVANLGFLGPDDVTLGASISNYAIADSQTTTLTFPPVKLDATPPRVLDIQPANNENNVSPSSEITVTFSEQIAPEFLNSNWFTIKSLDDGVVMSNVTLLPSLGANGTYVVHVIPPDPTPAQIAAGQKFRLKSNVIYSVTVTKGIQDASPARNPMVNTVAASFTTVNYTEPSIVSVDPPVDQPLPQQTTIRVRFNKAIDVTSFNAGNGGIAKLEQLDAYKGTPLANGNVPLSLFIDPQDAKTLVVAPTGVAIADSSFYRLTIAKTRDTQTPPNVQSTDRTFDYFSFDTKPPVVTIESPVPDGFPLIAGVEYTATASVHDLNTNNVSTDVAYVDWFDANGTFLKRVTTAPYGYTFVAPTTGTQFTLKSSAQDVSKNVSPSLTSFTWTVAPNNPPTDLAVTHTPSSVYPGGSVTTSVAFNDEGLKVTVGLDVAATNTDGTAYHATIDAVQVTRAKVSDAWHPATFTYTIPATVKDGTATITATATDAATKSSTKTSTLTILADAIAPQIVSIQPAAETHFKFHDVYSIVVKAKDAETSVAKVVFAYDGKSVTVTSHSTDANGVATFTTSVTVPPKNADTRIHIVATAYDIANNATPATTDVIYDSVNDAEVPKAAWITPLDGAALPTGQTNWTTTLRVRATDNIKVTQVKFESSALPSPVIVVNPKSGTADVYEANATLAMPSDLAPFVITATISDDDETHDVVLPITIAPVHPDSEITADFSINATNAATYAGKSLMIRGAGKRVFITVPLALQNLMVLDGAKLTNPDQTKIDLTIADHLFIDADSSVDVTGKGYLGGWVARDDNTSKNDSNIGMTLGATTTGGAIESASYAGIGGESPNGLSNATYGSITNPTDLGSGGGGSTDGHKTPGGSGGGAALLRGGNTYVIAGAIRADGGTGLNAGSGGSVLLSSHAIVTSADTRVTANGGTERGGGGRVSISASDRFDFVDLATLVTARGGHSSGSTDGGAGTIFVKRPGATNGELIVSSYDASFPNTTHLTKGTPLAGTLTFDALTVTQRALARLDNAVTLPSGVNPTVDHGALLLQPTDVPSITLTSTTPAAGSNVIQNTPITSTFDATSLDGVDHVRAILAASSTDAAVSFIDHPSTVTATNLAATIPATAAPGATTLKLRVVARSGRFVDTALSNFNIVANTPPSITQFDATPSSLYPGHSFSVTASATDDVAVTALNLTSTLGTVTSPAPQHFNVAIANNAAPGDVTLTLSASDGFPGRADTTQTKTVTVLQDTVAPVITITSPSQALQESTGGTFTVEATIVDAEVGVKTATATWEGQTTTLTPVAGKTNTYGATLPIPEVDGIDPVSKTLKVTASDFANNSIDATKTVVINPLTDPAAPTVAWICASPNAMFAAGTSVKLRISADGASQQNGVSRVEFTIDGAAPVVVTTPTNGNQYETTYAIPAGDAAGTVHNVLVAAISAGGNRATLTTTLTVISGTTIATAVTIDATQLSFENGTFIITTGGTLTVVGAHHFAKVAVLDGGALTQKQADLLNPLALTIDNLYVACNGTVDANAHGYKRSTYPGAGTPADAAGGGHMGRGGISNAIVGGTFGSIYRPLEAGGGGHVNDSTFDSGFAGAGGGIVRIVGTNVTIDGVVRANAREASSQGAGAGGSVYITATKLAGGGSAEANGATWSSGSSFNRGGGGGGAVAIEYDSVSGTIVNHLTSIGGLASGTGAAGTAYSYSKSTTASFGDLTITNGSRNSSLASQVVTDLPAFGIASVVSATNTTAVVDALWEGAYLAGNYLRVIAPDGNVRGTWRINNIANDASVRTVDGVTTIPLQATAYDGYLMYSDAGYGASLAHVVPVRNNGGTWQYDNGTTFTNFTPASGDKLFASFSKTSTIITTLSTFTCTSSCAPVAGLPALRVVRGEVWMNAAAKQTNFDYAIQANNSIFLARDYDFHGFVLSGGPVTVTLESGADVRTGDTVRGAYRFDHVAIKNARVYTPDLIVSTNTPTLDANSTLVPGNPAAPVVDATKITFTNGTNGPIINGSAGAVTGTAGPIDVIVRNASRTIAPVQWVSNGDVAFSTRNGLSMRKLQNGVTWGGRATMFSGTTAYGYITARSSQTNAQWDLLMTASQGNAEYDWALFTNATCQVWVNNSPVTSTFPYTTNTIFRIERTPTNVYFLLDGVVKFTASVDSRPRYGEVAFNTDNGEANSIEFGDAPALFTYPANGDGSFSIPILGASGDAISVTARDRYTFPLTSAAVSAGTLPSFGLTNLTIAPASLIAGHTAIGTITLAAPAGAQGALVSLTKSDNSVTIPATVTVPANTSSMTFNITTSPITAPITATITATYANVTKSATLDVAKDTTAPVVTITAPGQPASFNEGSGATFTVTATAVDADTGVLSVVANFDGTNYTMARDNSAPNLYKVVIPVPNVDGTTPVPKSLVVSATDNSNNTGVSSTYTINIVPLNDPNGPTISFTCATSNAVFPVGEQARFRVNAVGKTGQNGVTKVEFTIGSTTVLATNLGNNVYEGLYTVPASTDGTSFTVRATATSVAGNQSDVTTSFRAYNGSVFKTNTTIAAANTQFDNHAVFVMGSGITLTVGGHHNFTAVGVLDGATLTHAGPTTTTIERIDLTVTDGVYVACSSNIDVNSKGFGSTVNNVAYTYNDANSGTLTGGSTFDAASDHPSAGSHGGRGGRSAPAESALTFGSVYDPNEPGGAGSMRGTCGNSNCNPGGGIVRIAAQTVTVDGGIAANGRLDANGWGGGAGGSVRIDATTFNGVGSINANGADSGSASGGGGRVAVYYQTLGFDKTKILARGGFQLGAQRGTAGTIYLKGATQTNGGDLIIDNDAAIGDQADRSTDLPQLGTGTVTAISGATVTLSGSVPAFIEGSSVEFIDAGGAVKTYVIASRTATTITLKTTPTDVAAGMTYHGVWVFDSLTVKNYASFALEGVKTTSVITSGTKAFAAFTALDNPAMTLAGTIKINGIAKVADLTIDGGTFEVNGTVTSTTMRAIHSATVTSPQTIPTSVARLNINAQTLTIENGSAINVDGKGFGGTVSNVAYTYNDANSGTLNGGSTYDPNTGPAGGSHGGRGGRMSPAESALTYGSVYDPNEPGGAGSMLGTCSTTKCNAGGGIVRIVATTLTLDGSITAKGTRDANGWGGGAGGSVRIDAATFNGTGSIDASGANDGSASGGGGRIAVYYQTLGFSTAKILAKGGNQSGAVRGAAGTIYLKGSQQTNGGDLIVDNDTPDPADRDTALAQLGSGTITAVNGPTLTLSNAVPQFIEGSAIEILDATGAVKATYVISSRTSTTVTLTTTPADVTVGQGYHGTWVFDSVTVRNNGTFAADNVKTANLTSSLGGSKGFFTFTALNNPSMTVKGWVKVLGTAKVPTLTIDGGILEVNGTVTSTQLDVIHGATITSPQTIPTSVARVNISAATMTVDAASTINLDGKGFGGTVNNVAYTYNDANSGTLTGGSTYNNSSGPAGGSHGGRGGRVTGAESALTFGSVYDPNEPGGAGSMQGTCSTTKCNAGGGIVRIGATTLTLNGTITAKGNRDANGWGGGAGGSVRIDAATFNGTGTIDASGANDGSASGGGGRVAVYYQTLGFDRTKILARGGSQSAALRGTAGTIYLKRNDQTYGELIVDNTGFSKSDRATPLPAVGSGTISSVSSTNGGAIDRMSDSAAAFPAGALAGLRLFINNDRNVTWPILANDATSLTLNVSSTAFNGQPGSAYRGLARFDNVKLRNQNLTSADFIDALALDADTSLLITNAGPPVFDSTLLAQIRVSSTNNGSFIVGPAHAVTDSDTPIKLTARNTNSGATFPPANAAADGSFSVPVSGNVGDTFTLFATDSNASPMSSATINVNGAITTANDVASVTVDPASVTAGNSVAVTVRLSFPAAGSGVSVALTTSDGSALPVPATITIPAGSVAAQILVTAGSPSATTNVTITASTSSVTKSATLTVIPSANRLTSLALSSSSIEGGTSVNGTVTLGANAPAGGATVILSSSNNVAAVQPTVIVPQGANSMTFTVTTTAVGATVATSITATWGASFSAPLNVTACSTLGSVAAPTIPSGDNVWIEDAPPSGATATPSSAQVAFTTSRFASGSASLQFGAASVPRSWTMTATNAFNVGANDQLTHYMLVNPCNPPREVLFIWSDGTNEYRYSYGEDVIDTTTPHTRVGPLPAAGAWTRQTVLASTVGAAGKGMRSLTIKVADGGEVWIDHVGASSCSLAAHVAAPTFNSNEVVWFDDALPANALTGPPDSVTKTFAFDTTQSASGTQSHSDGIAPGAHQHYFYHADPIVPRSGDLLYTYVLIDPCNPPREVMLQFIVNDGATSTKVYWGEDVIGFGASTRIGPLPDAGKWVRLEVPASLVGLEGSSITGMAYSLYDGRAWFDRSGRITRVNVALKKPATQSSTLSGPGALGIDPVAGLAVDGNTDPAYDNGSTSHTLNEFQAWWQVDLGSVQPIENIVVYNIIGCCSNRLTNFYVLVSDDPFTSTDLNTTLAQAGVSAYHYYDQGPPQLTLAINRTGRYVRVQLVGANNLELPEVQVWAPASVARTNLAGGRSTSAISTLGGSNYAPDRAVNGVQNPADFFHSNQTSSSDWWETDLGSVQPISNVEVWNGTLDRFDRLQNFYVFVSDVPFTAKDIPTTLAQSGVGVYYFASPFGPAYNFPINRTGRYVRVQLTSSNFLTPSEVQVWSQLFALHALDAHQSK